MDRPVREHISQLEERIEKLNREAMEDQRSQDERNRIESEIRIAKLALAYYREALKIEKQLTQGA